MELKGLAENLNSIIDSGVKCDCGYQHNINARFLSGDTAEILKNIINEKAPCGEILLICYQSTFLSLGKLISTAVSEVNAKLITVTLKDSDTSTVQNASNLFNAHEDVRLAIVLDQPLLNLCAYFASVKKLPLIFVPQSFNVRGILSYYSYINVSGSFDRVKNDFEKYIILDQTKIILSDVSSAYAGIESQLSALIDYRVNTFVTGLKPCKTGYNIARSAIVDAFNILKVDKENRAEKLLENIFKLEIADNFCRGEFIYPSALSFAEYIAHGEKQCESDELFISLELLEIYNLYFNGEYSSITETADYINRATEIAKKTPLSETYIIKGLKEQLAIFKKSTKKIEEIKDRLKAEVSAIKNTAKKIKDDFCALGGKLPKCSEKIKYAVKFSGDAPRAFNTMTLARESGILEFID